MSTLGINLEWLFPVAFVQGLGIPECLHSQKKKSCTVGGPETKATHICSF